MPFKLYNDSYGHQAGDECLRKIASVISMLCETQSNFAARYGGEEFAILLPMADETSAILFASSVLATVGSLEIPHAGSMKGVVTVSIGVATTGSSHLQRVDQLVEAADRALYQAKASGRDCVKSSSRNNLDMRRVNEKIVAT